MTIPITIVLMVGLLVVILGALALLSLISVPIRNLMVHVWSRVMYFLMFSVFAVAVAVVSFVGGWSIDTALTAIMFSDQSTRFGVPCTAFVLCMTSFLVYQSKGDRRAVLGKLSQIVVGIVMNMEHAPRTKWITLWCVAELKLFSRLDSKVLAAGFLKETRNVVWSMRLAKLIANNTVHKVQRKFADHVLEHLEVYNPQNATVLIEMLQGFKFRIHPALHVHAELLAKGRTQMVGARVESSKVLVGAPRYGESTGLMRARDRVTKITAAGRKVTLKKRAN